VDMAFGLSFFDLDALDKVIRYATGAQRFARIHELPLSQAWPSEV
jgi:hypothetical protein